jgi:hypothetical protein
MLRRMKIRWWPCRSLTIVAVVVSCGPSLTKPSSQSVSGRWAATDPVGPLSVVELTISQQPDGVVSGQWSANVFPPDPPCPPGLGPNPTGSVAGTNTVLEVRLSLLGAGDFDGQVTDSNTLEGSFTSCEKIYAIVFSFVGPLPPP